MLCRREEEGSQYKLPGSGGPERGPLSKGCIFFCLSLSLSLSVVLNVIRYQFVLLKALAASGHLVCYTLCFVSLLIHLSLRRCWGPRTRSRRPWTDEWNNTVYRSNDSDWRRPSTRRSTRTCPCATLSAQLNSVALVRERTIPTERPPVGEVSANFCG